MSLGFLAFEVQNLSLVILLLTTLGTSAVGVLYPNLITLPNRSHNSDKLLNEIFARQHLAYAGFYLSVMIVAKFQGPNEWMARLLGLFVVVSLILFGVGLKLTTAQNAKINAHHDCPADNCDVELPGSVRFQVYGANAMLSAVNFILAFITAANPAISK